jgi:hypothetical protein
VAAPDWVTISSLATAGGTLVLAVATFGSVRSANRAARVAEESLLAGIRPLLMPSRFDDPKQKVGFADNHFVAVAGGCGTAEVTDDAVYLTLSLRNAGNGIAVLHGWRFHPRRVMGSDYYPDVHAFRRLTRDLYIASGDVGFWQGAFREAGEPELAEAREVILAREPVTIELLYGDHQGAQRIISLFALLPRDDDLWMATVSRHWNLDRPDPR